MWSSALSFGQLVWFHYASTPTVCLHGMREENGYSGEKWKGNDYAGSTIFI